MIAPSELEGTQGASETRERPAKGPPGGRPRSNSFHFVPVRDFARAPGAPCPLRDASAPRHDRDRSLLLRLRDRMRLVRTDTTDFAGDDVRDVKWREGQIYLDVSTKLAPDDFARDLRKLRLAAECASCERFAGCGACFSPVPGDVFTRDDAHLRAALGRLAGRVLDVGAGEGGYLEALCERAQAGAIEYVCVDPDRVALEVLASRHPFARFIASTVEDLADDTGTFDHVLVLRSYNHLADPAAVLARLIDLLRPNGTLTIADNVAFGLVRGAQHAARAEAARSNRFEHFRNDGAADAARVVDAILSSHSLAGRALRLVERREVGRETSNQWLLRYERVEPERLRA